MKHLHEIKKFTTGIVSFPSETDIPTDAASYSLNVDPMSEGGKLFGIKLDSTFGAYTDIGSMGLVDDGGNWSMVYVDMDSGSEEIKAIQQFYGTPAIGSLVGTTAVTPTVSHPPIQVWGKAAHIGLGGDRTSPSKWCGYIDKGQFGADPASTMYVYDSECKAPEIASGFHKIVRSGNNLFGIVYGGNILYKLDLSGDVTDNTDPTIININSAVAICTDTTNTHIYVYDWTSRLTGRVVKILASDLSQVASYPVVFDVVESTGLPNNLNGGEISDMEFDRTGELWVAAHSSTPVNGDAQLANPMIASGTIGSSGDPIEFGWHYFGMKENTDGTSHLAGHWFVNEDKVYFFTNPVSLIREDSGTNNSIGFVCRFSIPNPTATQWFPARLWTENGPGTTEYEEVSQAVILINPSNTEVDIQLDGNGGYIRKLPGVNGVVSGICREYIVGEDYVFIAHYDQSSNTSRLTLFDISETGEWNYDTASPFELVGIPDSIIAAVEEDTVILSTEFGQFCVWGDVDTNGTFYAFSTGGSRVFIDGTAAGAPPVLASITYDRKGDYSLIVSPTSRRDGELIAGDLVRYKVSFVYDDTQESPLSVDFAQTRVLSDPYEDPDGVTHDDTHVVDVHLQFYDSANLNKRITGLNIYQAIGSGGSPDSVGLYRRIKSVSFSGGDFYDKHSEELNEDAKQHLVSATKEGDISYEASSGLPETLQHSTVHYGISHVMNSEMIVGQCELEKDFYTPSTGRGVPAPPGGVPDESDADYKRHLFKSKPGQLDTFDTINDFVLCKAIPTAVTGYNNRFYAFDRTRTYKINPNPFVIEDVYEGIGCMTGNSVVSTEYGIFFADDHGIYHHDGSMPRKISYPVQDLWDQNRGVENGADPHILFNARRQAVLIFFQVSGAWKCLVYSLIHKGWWYWDAPSAVNAVTIGRDGEMFIANDTHLLEYLGSTYYRSYSWYSKSITMDADCDKKRFFSTRIQADGAISWGFGPSATFFGDDSSVTGVADHDGYTYKFRHPVWAEKFEIKIDNIPGNIGIDAIGVAVRRGNVAG